jgi:acrylyl-CoA reductase (NADPH)
MKPLRSSLSSLSSLSSISSISSVSSSRRGLSTSYRAMVVDSEGGKLSSRGVVETSDPRNALPRQDPLASLDIAVKYSTLNYKDGMIINGQRGVVPAFPIVPGIDGAGVVLAARPDPLAPLLASLVLPDGDEKRRALETAAGFEPGDEVVVTGNKIGQMFDGAMATWLSCKAGWAVKRPAAFTLEQTMAIGSAGHTAMMCVRHLEEAGGLERGSGADVLVTGAAGGLGSVAVAVLAARGYRVVASSRRADSHGEYLERLGAADGVGRIVEEKYRPLGKQQWAGVVDSVGGATLATALAQCRYNGAVASTGVAGGGAVGDMTVFPLILRGVRLLGVDSTLPWGVDGYYGYDNNNAVAAAAQGEALAAGNQEEWVGAAVRHRLERLRIWDALEESLSPEALDLIHTATVGLTDLPDQASAILKGNTAGRVVVDVEK